MKLGGKKEPVVGEVTVVTGWRNKRGGWAHLARPPQWS